MALYYWRQGLAYFLLASAFLIIYFVTMFSFVMMRRHVVHIYESGFIYRGRKIDLALQEVRLADGSTERYLRSPSTSRLSINSKMSGTQQG